MSGRLAIIAGRGALPGAVLTGLSEPPLVAAVEKANEAGILVVAAAGNKGPYPNTIDTPATSPTALTVGATIDYRTPNLSDDKVAWYSGTGPTSFDRLTKPDVIAPGTYIISTSTDGGYKKDTGTSMAAIVASTCAAFFSISVMPTTVWKFDRLIPRSRRNVSRISGHMARSAGDTYSTSKYGRRLWPRPSDGGRTSGIRASPSSSVFQGSWSSR